MELIQPQQTRLINNDFEETFYKKKVKKYEKLADKNLKNGIIFGMLTGVGGALITAMLNMPDKFSGILEEFLKVAMLFITTGVTGTLTLESILRTVGYRKKVESLQDELDFYRAIVENPNNRSMGGN